MRIALVTETYPPEINGVAMTLSRLVAGLLRLGHHVQLVRPKQSADTAHAESATHEELVLVSGAALPGYDGLRFGFPSYRRLRRLWTQCAPDFVHIATEGPLGWSALFAARALGIPVLSSYHTNFNSYAQHYGFGLLEACTTTYLKAFHNYTLATFVPTTVIREQLTEQGMKRVRVMSRGVDTDLFDPGKRSDALRQEWGAGTAAPVALYVGRIAAEKNLDLAIRGFYQIKAECPNARFVLVGDGPLREKLSKQYPDFIFTGFKIGAALAKCYATADIFLFPSMTETFGNVLTEAMASGLACVAYDYAAAKEYATGGVDALLAPLGDEATFLQAAREVVVNVGLRERLRSNATQLACSLNWSSVVNAYLEDADLLLRDALLLSK
ncbi:MAG: glycosyltransferase family 1 protein [Opitutales bacterium]|nr:glycosyltransferase family 1 protein [Opitutales bacterium]